MEDYKEFTGKSLDEAMAAACDYFGLERVKLEIEILSDAKSGIFGLVGAKRATVRARKARLDSLNFKVGAPGSEKKPQGKNSTAPRREKPAGAEKTPQKSESAPPKAENAPASAGKTPERQPAPEGAPKTRPRKDKRPEDRPENRADKGNETSADQLPENRADNRNESRADNRNESRAKNGAEKRPQGRDENPGGKRPGSRGRDRNNSKGEKSPRPKAARPERAAPAPGDLEEKFPEIPLESMDQARLEAEVLSAVDAMTRHIVGETVKEFEISGGKARVRIDSGEDSGLLIGRDGQTLSALQYLASCIVSRRLNASVRVQIDTGDYRNRQLEKLRALALELADKVRESGRPQSTRPMSAYLRRVVHMALQEDPDVQTHSKGEGSLKRVVIVEKKK